MSLNAREIYQEPEIKEVKKLKDGTVKLPVTHATSMGVVDFDFRLSKNKEGRLIITNATKITEKNKGYVKNVDKAYFLDASSPEAFAKSLGKALNEYIGEGRRSLDPEKRKKAYELLGYKKQLERESLEKRIQEELAQLKATINEVKESDHYNWDPEEKRLTVSYSIEQGFNSKSFYTIFQDQEDGTVKFTFKYGYTYSPAEDREETKIFSKQNLEKEVLNYMKQKV